MMMLFNNENIFQIIITLSVFLIIIFYLFNELYLVDKRLRKIYIIRSSIRNNMLVFELYEKLRREELDLKHVNNNDFKFRLSFYEDFLDSISNHLKTKTGDNRY